MLSTPTTGLTLTVSDPANGTQFRFANFFSSLLKAKAASFAGAALFTVASMPAPALFRSTAGVLSTPE